MMILRQLVFFAAALVLVTSFAHPAKAILLSDTGNFNIQLTQTEPGADSFSGMFTADNGVVTSFMAAVGDCTTAADCEYNIVVGLLWDGMDLSSGSANTANADFLDFDDPGVWLTFSSFDTIELRFGTYGVTEKIPEPSTIGLFAIGLAGLGVMTRRRRKQD